MTAHNSQYRAQLKRRISARQINRALRHGLRHVVNAVLFVVLVVFVIALVLGVDSSLHRFVFANFLWVVFIPVVTIMIFLDWVQRVQFDELSNGYSTDYYPTMSEPMMGSFAFVNFKNGQVLCRLDQVQPQQIEQLIAESTRIFETRGHAALVELPRYAHAKLHRTNKWREIRRPLYSDHLDDPAVQFLMSLKPWGEPPASEPLVSSTI